MKHVFFGAVLLLSFFTLQVEAQQSTLLVTELEVATPMAPNNAAASLFGTANWNSNIKGLNYGVFGFGQFASIPFGQAYGGPQISYFSCTHQLLLQAGVGIGGIGGSTFGPRMRTGGFLLVKHAPSGPGGVWGNRNLKRLLLIYEDGYDKYWRYETVWFPMKYWGIGVGGAQNAYPLGLEIHWTPYNHSDIEIVLGAGLGKSRTEGEGVAAGTGLTPAHVIHALLKARMRIYD